VYTWLGDDESGQRISNYVDKHTITLAISSTKNENRFSLRRVTRKGHSRGTISTPFIQMLQLFANVSKSEEVLQHR
jgi:hypothetical protein